MLICWGLWSEIVEYARESRPIKGLLHDQVQPTHTWFVEPYIKREVWCHSSQTLCQIDGTFRHANCNWISLIDGGFKDLTCSLCYSIRSEEDFRSRVRREFVAIEKRGTRDIGTGRTLKCVTIPELKRQ